MVVFNVKDRGEKKQDSFVIFMPHFSSSELQVDLVLPLLRSQQPFKVVQTKEERLAQGSLSCGQELSELQNTWLELWHLICFIFHMVLIVKLIIHQ